jgi:hypothetical protein
MVGKDPLEAPRTLIAIILSITSNKEHKHVLTHHSSHKKLVIAARQDGKSFVYDFISTTLLCNAQTSCSSLASFL